MKGNSDRLNELISAYIDGEVTANEKAEVEELLRKDQVAAELYSKLRTTKKLLGTMQPLSAPVVLSKKLTQQFQVLKQQNFFDRLRSMLKPVTVPVPVFTYLGAIIIISIIFFYSSSILFVHAPDQATESGQTGAATAGRSVEKEAPAEQVERFTLEPDKKSGEEETAPSSSTGLLEKDLDREDSAAGGIPQMADATTEAKNAEESAEGVGAGKAAPGERSSEETFAYRANEMKAGAESAVKPAAPTVDNRLKTEAAGAQPKPEAVTKPKRTVDDVVRSRDEIERRKAGVAITINPVTGKIIESPPLMSGTISRTTYRAEILQETIRSVSSLPADEGRQVSGYSIHSVSRGGKNDKRLAQYFTRAQQPALKQENTLAAPIPDIDFQAVDPAADDLSYFVTGEMQVADNGRILQLRITGHPAARFLIDSYADHLQNTPMIPAYAGNKPVPVFYRFIATIHRAR